MLSFICNHVVSVRRGFFVLLVLGIGLLVYYGTSCDFHTIIIISVQYVYESIRYPKW